MTTLKATIKGRRLEFDAPPDWPDGTEVEIHPLEHGANGDQGTMSPDDIARTLAAMDQVEPFDMTDVERAAGQAERQARKEGDKAQFAERAEKLRQEWEWPASFSIAQPEKPEDGAGVPETLALGLARGLRVWPPGTAALRGQALVLVTTRSCTRSTVWLWFLRFLLDSFDEAKREN